MHQDGRHIVSSSDSNDQEDEDCGNGLSSEDAGDGKNLDSDEDDDLNGKDAAMVQSIFNQEVCPVTAFLHNMV